MEEYKPGMPNKPQAPAGATQMASIVERNIQTLLEHRREFEKRRGLQDKLADSITRFTGSMIFVYLHMLIFGAWIFINLGWIPRVPRFDPSFVVLAMVASVEAIFLSTFVLISQNRMQVMADRRAELDVQISLLAEHEVTRVIQLVSAIADRLGLEAAKPPELDELEQDVRPEAVLDYIEGAQSPPRS